MSELRQLSLLTHAPHYRMPSIPVLCLEASEADFPEATDGAEVGGATGAGAVVAGAKFGVVHVVSPYLT